MLVKCSLPYVLKANDVVWTPVSQRNGADVYLLDSSGVITIYVDDVRVFYFQNNIVPDFHFSANIIRFFNGSNVIKTVNGNTSYIQSTPPSEEVTSITIGVFPIESVEDVMSLNLSVNNGNGSINWHSTETNALRITLTDYDKSDYLRVKLGNVLLAFITPEE